MERVKDVAAQMLREPRLRRRQVVKERLPVAWFQPRQSHVRLSAPAQEAVEVDYFHSFFFFRFFFGPFQIFFARWYAPRAQKSIRSPRRDSFREPPRVLVVAQVEQQGHEADAHCGGEDESDHRITHESSPGTKPKREPESQLT